MVGIMDLMAAMVTMEVVMGDIIIAVQDMAIVDLVLMDNSQKMLEGIV